MDRLTLLWLYDKASKQKLFTFADLGIEKKRRQQLKNLLSKAIKKKRIKRIWNRLYYIVPFDNPAWKPSPWHIIRHLCKKAEGHAFYFTALEAHALKKPSIAPQKELPSKDIFILAGKKGTGIERKSYEGHEYIIYRKSAKAGKVPWLQDIQITTTATPLSQDQFTVPCTDIEETFLELLQRIEDTLPRVKTGLELLELFKKADMDIPKVLAYLERHNSLLLNSRAGLMLELIDTEGKHTKLLDKLSKGLSKKPYYFRKPHTRYIGLAKEHFKHISRWNIMVPNSIYSLYELQSSKASKQPEGEILQQEAPLPEETNAHTEIT